MTVKKTNKPAAGGKRAAKCNGKAKAGTWRPAVDPSDWDDVDVSFEDAFGRACCYIENCGYRVCVTDSEVSILLSGENAKSIDWCSRESFLFGVSVVDDARFEKKSVFELARRWNTRRTGLDEARLKFIDSCDKLAVVRVKEKTPVGLMKALDVAYILE